uniref:CCDC50_N domain-containing protein n=1 Tax=Heterorhabditis bacteriophora TaxID=37862 RepID=A0A1I7XV31_HETBA
MVDEQRPSVAEVTSRLRVFEDHNLAVKLQEEEFNRHYNRNRVDRRTIGSDTKHSKDEQAREDQTAREMRMRINKHIEESDEDVARRLQREFEEEERRQREEKERQSRMDAEVAQRIANLGANSSLETTFGNTSFSSSQGNHAVDQENQSSPHDLIDLSSPTEHNKQHEFPLLINKLHISNKLGQLNDSSYLADSRRTISLVDAIPQCTLTNNPTSIIASATTTFPDHPTISNHPSLISTASHSSKDHVNVGFTMASTNTQPSQIRLNAVLPEEESPNFSWPDPPERIIQSASTTNNTSYPSESDPNTMFNQNKSSPYKLDPTNPFLQDLATNMQTLTPISTMSASENTSSRETRRGDLIHTSYSEQPTNTPPPPYYSEFGLPPPSDTALGKRKAGSNHH